MTISSTPDNTISARRRTVVRGAAWSIPALAVGAPAAIAQASQCQYDESYQIGPNETVNIRAICRSDSQEASNPQVVEQEYGTGFLPAYLEICNCQPEPAWYRWQERDSRSYFQIEVDGVHNDQNSATQGFRPPFQLDEFGTTGGCQIFDLTYRASNTLPTSDQEVTITWTLQRGPSESGPWSELATFTRTGTVRRDNATDVDFICEEAGASTSRSRVSGDVD